jgi:hypothetical protein
MQNPVAVSVACFDKKMGILTRVPVLSVINTPHQTFSIVD